MAGAISHFFCTEIEGTLATVSNISDLHPVINKVKNDVFLFPKYEVDHPILVDKP